MAMIFVVGVGRCGSSALARVMHETGICCMGHIFRKPDSRNTQGYWEDLYIRKRILSEFADPNIPAQDVLRKVMEYHKKYRCKAKRIGYKHPLLADVSHDRWLEIGYDHIFWAQRELDQVIESYRKWEVKGYSDARLRRSNPEDLVRDRNRQLIEALHKLPRVTSIDFSERRTDEWIKNQVVSALEGAKSDCP